MASVFNNLAKFDYDSVRTSQPDKCDSCCESTHQGRNCLHCRRAYGTHDEHKCLDGSERRGDFSLEHQDYCGEDCGGVLFGKPCLICGKLFDYHDGHYCDKSIRKRGDFREGDPNIKPAKRK